MDYNVAIKCLFCITKIDWNFSSNVDKKCMKIPFENLLDWVKNQNKKKLATKGEVLTYKVHQVTLEGVCYEWILLYFRTHQSVFLKICNLIFFLLWKTKIEMPRVSQLIIPWIGLLFLAFKVTLSKENMTVWMAT